MKRNRHSQDLGLDENNIKMDNRGTGFGGVEKIHLAQDMGQ